jgi:hypothetical protein
MKRQGRQLSPAGGGGSRRAAVDPCGQREDESIPASATPMLPHHETFPRGFPTRAVVEAVASRWEVVVDSSAAGVDESMTEAGGERTSRRPTQRGGVGTGGAVVWSLCGRRMRMSGGWVGCSRWVGGVGCVRGCVGCVCGRVRGCVAACA